MSSLLRRLQTALNKLDGNTMNMVNDDSIYPEYFCTRCTKRVYEDQYNMKHAQCYECFYKEE